MAHPHAPPYATTLSPDDMSLLSLLWGSYWDGQILSEYDTRLPVIALLRSFFHSPEGRPLFEAGTQAYRTEPGAPLIITLDYPAFVSRFPAADFRKMLYEQPFQTLALVGLGASLALGLDPRETGECQGLQARFEHVEPVVPMGCLKSGLVGHFVTVKGTVARASAIRPLVLGADFECPKCGVCFPMKFADGIFQWPEACPTPRCKNKQFELRRETAATVDFQKIKLQEMDYEGAEPGRIPRTVEVELRGDMVDACVPGDVVTVAGVIKTISTEALSGRRAARDGKHQSLYLLYVQANSMHNKRQAERLADEELEQMERMMDSAALAAAGTATATDFTGLEEGGAEEFSKIEGHFHLKHLGAIRAIASDPLCFHLLVASLCPPIVGHELVKAGLLLTLLGGTKRTDPTSARTRVRVRSDPHILLVGDPGLGKSQMLRACHDAAPRAVYLCGTMATSTGLTVTLVNDGRGDVALEAGALVLSDQGVCCIDELDKLSCSYHALLEAMEQQQISIAKSGVVTSLSARCSVMAAANPVGGQYQRGKTVSENLKMSGALFSRFDLVFIMLDRADDEHDARVSRQVVRMHAQRGGGGDGGGGGSPPFGGGGGGRGGGEMGVREEDLRDRETRSLSQRLRLGVDLVKGDPVPKELLRKYLAYARKYVHPRLTPPAAAVLKEFYLHMRAEARLQRSCPITTRQLESLIRLAQARAKAELREDVSEDDALDVVEMMQESLEAAQTTEAGAVVDFALHSGSMSLSRQVKAFVSALTRESHLRGSSIFPRVDLEQLATKKLRLQIADFDRFLDVLNNECYLLKKSPRLYKVMTSDVGGGFASLA